LFHPEPTLISTPSWRVLAKIVYWPTAAMASTLAVMTAVIEVRACRAVPG
jgi:hypothetical protein